MAGGLLVVDAYVLHYPLSWRVATTGLVDDARLELYSEALRIISENPWWGIGDAAVGQRAIALPRLHSLPQTQQNVHNQYLQWAAAEGIPVGIGFTLLVLWAVVWCWRHAPAWPTPLSRAVGWATAIGLTTFLLANLADAHFWRIEGGGFFWSLLAVNAAVARSEMTRQLDA
jgi:O-antigen ligase